MNKIATFFEILFYNICCIECYKNKMQISKFRDEEKGETRQENEVVETPESPVKGEKSQNDEKHSVEGYEIIYDYA